MATLLFVACLIKSYSQENPASLVKYTCPVHTIVIVGFMSYLKRELLCQSIYTNTLASSNYSYPHVNKSISTMKLSKYVYLLKTQFSQASKYCCGYYDHLKVQSHKHIVSKCAPPPPLPCRAFLGQQGSAQNKGPSKPWIIKLCPSSG